MALEEQQAIDAYLASQPALQSSEASTPINVYFHVINNGSGLANGDVPESQLDAQIITSGQRVRIPSETRLTFVLDSAVRF